MDQLIKSIFQVISDISNTIGTGVLIYDALIFTVFISFVALFISMSASRQAAALKTLPSIEKIHSISGRIEKLEMNLNEFRTETLRSLELFRADVGHLKQDIAEIRQILSEAGRGGSSGGGTGGSQAGGAGNKDDDRHGPGSGFRLQPKFFTEEINQKNVTAATTKITDVNLLESATSHLENKLSKSRTSLFAKIKSLFGVQKKISFELLHEIEAILLSSDIGTRMTSHLIAAIKEEMQQGKELDQSSLLQVLKEKIYHILLDHQTKSILSKIEEPSRKLPFVIMVVGVNGVGKTTTVAKLAQYLSRQGKKVILVAADTFRAAAVEQLKNWAERINVPLIFGANNEKPATVVYEAMLAAKKEEVDVVIIDTAGRLHTKSNLMQELQGIKGAISRHLPDAPHEVLLVLDASTGQNAISQAREFNAAVNITGLIITKLDGTSKGGVVVAIKDELNIPIRYIGVGEAADDLLLFDAKDFVAALFADSSEARQILSKNNYSEHDDIRRKRRPASNSHQMLI